MPDVTDADRAELRLTTDEKESIRKLLRTLAPHVRERAIPTACVALLAALDAAEAERKAAEARCLRLEAQVFKMAEWLLVEKRVAEETIAEGEAPGVMADAFRQRVAEIAALLDGSAGESHLASLSAARDALPDLLAALDAKDAEVGRLTEERDKLQRFKDWVHAYLDAHGVPHHPPGTHGAEGCRIGDRMDWLMADLAARDRRVAELEAGLRNLLAVISDSDQRKHPSSMRLLGIVSGRPEYEAIDAARALLAPGGRP